MFYLLGKWLRRLFYGIDFTLYTALVYLLSFLPRRLVRPVYSRLFFGWCRSFVRALGVELRLHQHNTRPLPRQYLLIANHPSAFEDIGIPALFPVHSLAKAEVRDWWIVGRISVAADTLFVQREERESRRAAFDAIVEALELGRNVAVYPEGGCKGRRIFETFRYGVFEISLKTGTPIVPVFLHYESQDDFEWKPGETLLHKLMHFFTTQNPRANYHVYDALDPAAFADRESYMRHAHGLYLQWQARYLD
ncbi:MAG TPA: 1-acyl-sn-glycerol-3-phosphate acyltransferase [Thioalkalivibrio sp.]|nr:1-acyl-sn-glycerol-3-phosphate acyltransferase [Thioalkalivibrio sp.]